MVCRSAHADGVPDFRHDALPVAAPVTVKGPSHKLRLPAEFPAARQGDEAEAAFDAVPDRVFKGRALILDVGAVFEAVTVEDGDMPERGKTKGACRR